jgi:hypothetical protein
MLRFYSILLLLSGPALAQAPGAAYSGPRCFANTIISKSVVINPLQNFYDETTIWFENSSQRQRVDITFRNPNENPAHVRFYLFPSQGVFYRIQQNECTKGEYTIPLAPQCFSPAALAAARRVTLGRQTLMEVDFQSPLTNDKYHVYASGQFLVPVSIFSSLKSSPNMLTTFVQYYEYQQHTGPLPDQSVFNLPASCQGL